MVLPGCCGLGEELEAGGRDAWLKIGEGVEVYRAMKWTAHRSGVEERKEGMFAQG